ncbi:MAG TPA: CCA tRNA nucleotidyltransferase, partial [Candidatus Paceibacterota bacterium]
MEIKPSNIPSEVLAVVETLEAAGHEAYIVGGCVRDLLLGRKPKDWDVTTNATPEVIQSLFDETYYTNEFGTVGVVNASLSDESLKVVEVTPYRLEGRYSDFRRPDEVVFSQSLADDLKRRDFTINALAYNPKKGELVDLYDGIKDIEAGVVRAVGDAKARFEEDALRLMRAIRIAAELGFAIEANTLAAIGETANQLEKISKERVQAEFVRIINSDKPMDALVLSQKLGLLRYIVPELEEGIGIEQNQAHKYDVWEHNLRALQHAADKNWPFSVRLAALLHDIGKPKSRRYDEGKKDWTFHGHDVVGARMTKKLLEGLKFPRETVANTASLVRWHMFFSDPEKITLSAVRRIIRNVGPEHIDELINLRICDRIGTG